MTKILAFFAFLTLWNVGVAQDLLITNARIIDGTGATIDQGSVVVRDGRIVSVSTGSTDAAGSKIDAQGMTVMPGLIDTHRHLLNNLLLTSDEEMDEWVRSELPETLRELLAAGVTTTLSANDAAPWILRVRERVADGTLVAPRILTSGPGLVRLSGTGLCRDNAWCHRRAFNGFDNPELARARVEELANAGVDSIKIYVDPNGAGEMLANPVIAAIAQEAEQHGIPVIADSFTIDRAIEAVSLGVDRLVHTPNRGPIDRDQARRLRDAGIPVSTTSGPFASMRDEAGVLRAPFGGEYTEEREERLAWTMSNIRTLWDEGVTIAFGTDSPPLLTIAGTIPFEAKTLSEVLTNDEIVASITRNAASYIELENEIGTLEAQKIADIVIIDGDPLTDIGTLANVEVVIQGGRVVVDNR